MKVKLASLLALFAMALSLLACSSALKQTSVTVAIDEFLKQNNISREIQVATNDTFTVTLGSNPTTGFNWVESAKISDQAVLQQLEHKYVPPQGSLPGASGQEVWTFRALKAGKTTVSMDYSRPWEGGEKNVWTFTLTVSVK